MSIETFSTTDPADQELAYPILIPGLDSLEKYVDIVHDDDLPLVAQMLAERGRYVRHEVIRTGHIAQWLTKLATQPGHDNT